MSNRVPNPSPAGHSVATTDPEKFLGIRADDGNGLDPSARPCAGPAPRGGSTVQGSGSWRDLAVAGATHALRTWVAYWLLECFLWTVWPWLSERGYEYTPTHPWLSPLALAAYILVGGTLGAAIAIALGRVLPHRAQSAMPLVGPLSLALIIGIVSIPNSGHVELLIALLLGTVIVTSLRRPTWVETVRRGANFCSVPLGLLAYPFARTLFANPPTAHFIGILAALAVFVVTYVATRFPTKTAPRNQMRASIPGRSLAVWVSLVAVAIAMSPALKQRPLLTASTHPVAAARSGVPNVILISLDTVRADHLSLYGYARDTSPNLQKFAQEATVFINAISPSDMTLSSHASMFTGLYASQHGAHAALGRGTEGLVIADQYGLRLPENSQTMATILSDRGYRTIGIVANITYLQHAFRLDQGFQYYSQPNPILLLQQQERGYLRTNLSQLLGHFCPRAMSDLSYVRAADINREAFQLLQREQTAKRPLFLFLNYMDAHQPYFPPTPYDSRYPGKDPNLTKDQYWDIECDALALTRPYTARDRQRDESQYDGGIAYMDASLNSLLAQLKDLGLYDNSLIIITSDHGQSFGEKQLVGHGSSMYQEQVHVPLIVKYPGQSQRAVRSDLVSLVDLLPTVLDLLGEKVPSSLPGRSLRTLTPGPVTVISESFPSDLMVSFNPRFRRIERAAFSGPFKLILATNRKGEFYDLSSDPHEEHDLYSQDLLAASRLETELRHWISTLPAEHARPAVLNKKAVDKLKSLGYVQ